MTVMLAATYDSAAKSTGVAAGNATRSALQRAARNRRQR